MNIMYLANCLQNFYRNIYVKYNIQQFNNLNVIIIIYRINEETLIDV